MGEVGEPEAAREQRRVGELELVPGLDELGRRPARDRSAGAEVPGGGASDSPAARVDSSGRSPIAEHPPDQLVGRAERELGAEQRLEPLR